MKRDILLVLFGMVLTYVIADFGQWVNPNNWPSVLKLLTTSVWQTIFIILIVVAIGLVMWAILRAIGKLDEAKDTKKTAEMKKVVLQALKDVGLEKKDESKQKS